MESKQRQLNNNKVGIYMRLSKDDERNGESLSIENQRIILMKYITEKGWQLYDEYADDGYSGTNFDRPEVQRMFDDAKTGKINTIVVKDLSRFGRNYILVGQYLDYVFPLNGIRFIAISDNVDTANKNSSGMDMMPILNVFNEWHSANTSKKIRAVIEANARNGKCRAVYAPYGYLKGDNENKLPVIDEYASKIVQRIFEMRASGLGKRIIAQRLSEEGIEPPSVYKNRINEGYSIMSKKKVWNGSEINNILHNPVYIGNLAQLKTTTLSYKNKKQIKKPQDEWVVVEGTHEPIISRELWDKCREVDRSVSKGKSTTKEKTVKPLSGLMYCPQCGSKMRLQYNLVKKKGVIVGKVYGYNCAEYLDTPNSCKSRRIQEEAINEIVLQDIRSKARLVLDDEEGARAEFLRKQRSESTTQAKSDAKRLRIIEKRLSELDSLIQATYEDRVLKRVPENLCIELLKKYQDERVSLGQEATDIKEQTANESKINADVDEFIRKVKEYLDLKELTRDVCLELISHITVGPVPKTKDEPREIHIYYKLIDKQSPPERVYISP